jgi:hypothetical protein
VGRLLELRSERRRTKSIFTGVLKFIVGRGFGKPVLGAPICPSRKLESGSHMAAQNAVPKKYFLTNLIQIAIHIFL